jgi:hypothetical protein
MRFNVYIRRDGCTLAVPSVFMPAAFIEQAPQMDLLGEVRIAPEQVSNAVFLALGLQGYAELSGEDLELFNTALGSQHLHLPGDTRHAATS